VNLNSKTEIIGNGYDSKKGVPGGAKNNNHYLEPNRRVEQDSTAHKAIMDEVPNFKKHEYGTVQHIISLLLRR
jgi:hypothetical protein